MQTKYSLIITAQLNVLQTV